MIQEIAPHRFNPEYTPHPPRGDDYILIFTKREVLLQAEGDETAIPTLSTLQPLMPGLANGLTYLFSIDGKSFYLALDAQPPQDPRLQLEGTGIFRTMQPAWAAFAMITGNHLYNWYHTHRFCGVCGAGFGHSAKERALVCPACGNMEFPRISPAVIVGITRGNEVLVTKYAGREYAKYALIGGFVEIGESYEDTVRREVMEEVGLRVKNIRYYKSQPWALTGTLLAGFWAELDGDGTIHMDANELAEAAWITRQALPDDPNFNRNTLSLTYDMFDAFINGRV